MARRHESRKLGDEGRFGAMSEGEDGEQAGKREGGRI